MFLPEFIQSEKTALFILFHFDLSLASALLNLDMSPISFIASGFTISLRL